MIKRGKDKSSEPKWEKEWNRVTDIHTHKCMRMCVCARISLFCLNFTRDCCYGDAPLKASDPTTITYFFPCIFLICFDFVAAFNNSVRSNSEALTSNNREMKKPTVPRPHRCAFLYCSPSSIDVRSTLKQISHHFSPSAFSFIIFNNIFGG